MVNACNPFLIAAAAAILFSGCSGPEENTVVTTDCHVGVKSLLISEAVFPPQWLTQQTRRPVSHHYAIHRCSRSFLVTNGVAFQDVYEYRSEADASQSFARQKARFFTVDEFGTGWEEPAFALQFYKPSVDEFYLACQSRGGVDSCQLLAQYGRFTVVFYSHMSPHYMSGEEFTRIVQAIDSKFTVDGN